MAITYWDQEDLDALRKLWDEGTLTQDISFHLSKPVIEVMEKAKELGLAARGGQDVGSG